jgi:hypothetical protein
LPASPALSKQHKDAPSTQPANVQVLSNQDIIAMTNAGLDSSVIIDKIKASSCNFDTSPDALIKLKQAGASEAVIAAMVQAHSVSNTHGDAPQPCVILKRMGPADQVTSHLHSFGIRGKQFQYVEGELPKGVKFHGRLTDHDVRKIEDHGGKITVISAHYTDEELQDARKSCSQSEPPAGHCFTRPKLSAFFHPGRKNLRLGNTQSLREPRVRAFLREAGPRSMKNPIDRESHRSRHTNRPSTVL